VNWDPSRRAKFDGGIFLGTTMVLGVGGGCPIGCRTRGSKLFAKLSMLQLSLVGLDGFRAVLTCWKADWDDPGGGKGPPGFLGQC
jgi:hypothetical protein